MNTRRYLTGRRRPPVWIVAMAALCVIAASAVARAVEVQDRLRALGHGALAAQRWTDR
jgi:hypothetical protein